MIFGQNFDRFFLFDGLEMDLGKITMDGCISFLVK